VSIVVSACALSRRRHAAALSAFVLSACGGGGTEPEPVGPPAAVVVSAGNQQTGQAGALLPAPIAAKVTDAGGRGVPNIPVAFAVSVGGGTIETTSGTTNGAGIATASWRMGTIAGRQEQVVASVLDTLTGALVDTAIFVATVTAGPPATVFSIGGNGIVVAIGQTTPVPLRALVRDAFGNVVGGATVNWTVFEGQATLGAATSVSNSQGEAANTLTPGQAAGDIVVRASVAGVSSPTSFLLHARNVSERAAYLRAGGFGIARTPAGQLVVTLIGSSQVERVSLTNPSSSALAAVAGTPVVIAVDGSGQRAYAANMGTGVLNVIDIPSMTKVADVDIPGEAHSLAMSPRGDRVYVTNTSNSVFGVDVATRTIVSTSPTGSGPWGIAFWTTPSDSLMYVTARDGGSITEVNMRTGSAVRTIGVTGRPHGIAISPNGSTLYVADDRGEILFVDRVSGATTRRITAGGAFGMAIAPDGNTLYVTTNPGYILVVDVASATITKQVSTEGEPRQILVMPDGNSALAANLGGWVDLVRR
jgi:YVTN family beta-propeller protein